MKHIVIQTQVYFLLPLVFLFPDGWIISWMIAATLHEFSHLLVLYIFRVRILALEIGIMGAKIVTEPITSGKEFVVALAGPAGGLLLLGLSRYCPQIAICALAQSVYNLLPIYPLDGGRVVRCLLTGNINPKELFVFEKCVICFVIFIVLVIGIWLKLGILPIILAVSLVIQYRNGNIPCKDQKQRVQ